MGSSTHSAERTGTPEEQSRRLEALHARREECLSEPLHYGQRSRNAQLRKIALEASELDRDFAIETALTIGTIPSRVRALGELGERLGGDAVIFQVANEVSKEGMFYQGREKAIGELVSTIARFYPRYATEVVRDSLQEWEKEDEFWKVVGVSGDLEAARELQALLLKKEDSWKQGNLERLVKSTAEAHPEFAAETIELMEDGENKDAAREALEQAKARRETSQPFPTPAPDKTFPRLSRSELGQLIWQAKELEQGTYPASATEAESVPGSIIDTESFSRLSEGTARLYVESLVRIGEELHDSAVLAEAAYLAAQLEEGETKDGLLLRIIKTADPDTLRSAIQRQR